MTKQLPRTKEVRQAPASAHGAGRRNRLKRQEEIPDILPAEGGGRMEEGTLFGHSGSL